MIFCNWLIHWTSRHRFGIPRQMGTELNGPCVALVHWMVDIFYIDSDVWWRNPKHASEIEVFVKPQLLRSTISQTLGYISPFFPGKLPILLRSRCVSRLLPRRGSALGQGGEDPVPQIGVAQQEKTYIFFGQFVAGVTRHDARLVTSFFINHPSSTISISSSIHHFFW